MKVSASKINMYLRCGLQYYFRYEQGIKIPPPGIVITGSSAHKALEFNFTQKIESRIDKKVDEVLDCFSDTFELKRNEAEFKDDEKPAELKDKGISVLRKFQTENSPLIQPVKCENKSMIIFENDHELEMYIDMIDDKDNIWDHKLSSRKKTGNEDLLQLSLYSYAIKKSNQHIVKCCINNLVITKEPQVNILPVIINDDQRERSLMYVSSVINAIQKQVFLPAPPNSWICSEKWCGYWNLCRGGKKI